MANELETLINEHMAEYPDTENPLAVPPRMRPSGGIPRSYPAFRLTTSNGQKSCVARARKTLVLLNQGDTLTVEIGSCVKLIEKYGVTEGGQVRWDSNKSRHFQGYVKG